MSAEVHFLFDLADASVQPQSFEQEQELGVEPVSFEQELEPNPVESRYDASMNMPTREELDAKLEAIEARMDLRVAAIQTSIDSFVVRMDERSRSMDERMSRIEGDSRETKAAVANLKSTMIVTAISTVLAIVLGVAAFNATVLSNMTATFEAGKNTITSQAELKKVADETAARQLELKRQSEETAALLEQMHQRANSPVSGKPQRK